MIGWIVLFSWVVGAGVVNALMPAGQQASDWFEFECHPMSAFKVMFWPLWLLFVIGFLPGKLIAAAVKAAARR